jgi:hypothetical protein
MNLFGPFRKLLKKLRPPHRPRAYTLRVYLQHPRLVRSIVKVNVRIYADNKTHARRLLKDELKIVVGGGWRK